MTFDDWKLATPPEYHGTVDLCNRPDECPLCGAPEGYECLEDCGLVEEDAS